MDPYEILMKAAKEILVEDSEDGAESELLGEYAAMRRLGCREPIFKLAPQLGRTPPLSINGDLLWKTLCVFSRRPRR